MIKTISDLLLAFVEQEKIVLDANGIKHAPTIGSMYEGLTTKVLQKALPEGIALQVVSGFIINSKGNISPQVDCMIVKKIFETIPHTIFVKCHIDDVLAVFEVKKKLYTADIKDAFPKLRSVLAIQHEEFNYKRLMNPSINIRPAKKIFSHINGNIAPNHEQTFDLKVIDLCHLTRRLG